MSDGPQMDMGAQLFARGPSQGGKIKTDDYVNDENAAGQHMKASVDHAADAAKVVLPGFLGKITLIFSGQSAATGLENEGLSGKMIMPSIIPDLNGGMLAMILKALGKNSAITDHTQDLTGGAPIEGGFSGDGFSGDGVSGGGDFLSMAGAPNSYGDFEWSPASRADLGTFSPPNVGDAGMSSELAV